MVYYMYCILKLASVIMCRFFPSGYDGDKVNLEVAVSTPNHSVHTTKVATADKDSEDLENVTLL